jgi:hypothetical protein
VSEPVYESSGDLFVPTERARGPWSPGAQHGGPPTGLLARAILKAAPAGPLRLARITADLFRTIPMAPFTTRAEVVRSGRRVALVRAELVSDDRVVAVAYGALLAVSDVAPREYPATLAGPEGFSTGKLLPETVYAAIGHGFHSTVEVRWVSRERPCAAWFRLPGPLVAREGTHPFVCAATMSDFVNALMSLGGGQSAAFINTDTTVYFGREPAGEWIGLSATGAVDSSGVGFGEVLLLDHHGCFGRAVQARLANTSAWRG